MLQPNYSNNDKLIEAGCDEAGRGCLAGPVVAAAVVLGENFDPSRVKDSKVLSLDKRLKAREYIEINARAFWVASTCNEIIDQVNILNASIQSMHKAVDGLSELPDLLLIDGNRFKPYRNLQHVCLVKGDAHYAAIAAASILAKTYRDEMMCVYHERFPQYQWDVNKGYPTHKHREAIAYHGISPIHRKTFTLLPKQLKIF
jgi:ribonuclease HII